MKSLFSILFLLVSINLLFAQNDNTEVSIAGTHQLEYASTIAGQKYNLYINLPLNYQDTTKTFPVVYVLDAQWDFTLAYAIYGELYYDGFIPGVVLVGITWGGTNPDYDSLRAYDFTPTDVSGKGRNGNASTFLRFIKKELIPFIESKYRVSKVDRTLMGSSLGGLFTLYTFFNETELFNNYVLTSPAIGWDNYVINNYENDFLEKEFKKNIKIFMGMGEYEDVQNFQKFTNLLKEKEINNLDLQSKVLTGMGHSSGKAIGFSKGLQFVFKRPLIKLDPAALEKYTGEYKTNNLKANIKIEDGYLTATTSNNRKYIFNAETDKDFYVVGSLTRIHFKADNSGKILGFQLEYYGGETFVNKITKASK